MPFSSVLGASSAIKPGVVTSSTRPSTPYVGQLIFETDTNRLSVWNGSSWIYMVDADTPPALEMISPTSVAGTGVSLSGGKVSFTSASTISVNGCFSAAYSNYRVVINAKYGSTSESLRLRMRSSGTDNTGGYYTHAIYTTHAGGPSRTYDSNFAYGSLGWVSDISYNVTTEFHNPFAADYTGWVSHANGIGNTTAVVGTLWGMHLSQASFDGFTMYPPSSSVTGSLRIYGYRESI